MIVGVHSFSIFTAIGTLVVVNSYLSMTAAAIVTADLKVLLVVTYARLLRSCVSSIYCIVDDSFPFFSDSFVLNFWDAFLNGGDQLILVFA
jgi:hypothetical protein